MLSFCLLYRHRHTTTHEYQTYKKIKLEKERESARSTVQCMPLIPTLRLFLSPKK